MKIKNIYQTYFRGRILLAVLLLGALSGCHSGPKPANINSSSDAGMARKDTSQNCCTSALPSKPFLQMQDSSHRGKLSETSGSKADMVLIPGGTFVMGGDSVWGRSDEFPRHRVQVSSFYMDRHEVTNRQF